MSRNNSNKGFTLIELLLVMSISLLLLSLVLISFNVVNNANLNKAARRLENVIRLSRTRSMAKGTEAGKLKLYMQNGNLYAVIGEDDSPQLICNGGIQVKGMSTSDYDLRVGGVALNGLPDGNVIKFSTSGIVQTFSGTPVMNKFILNKGNRSFEVILYTETGNVETYMF